VASKRTSAARRRTRETEKAVEKPIGLIVRRGALRRFDELKKKTADLPVTVTWDRRQTERRTAGNETVGGDGRHDERRQAPPFTWEMADFVVVAPPARKSARAKATSKKK
jgi:hypothetical protein